jgi:hypothetical protein
LLLPGNCFLRSLQIKLISEERARTAHESSRYDHVLPRPTSKRLSSLSQETAARTRGGSAETCCRSDSQRRVNINVPNATVILFLAASWSRQTPSFAPPQREGAIKEPSQKSGTNVQLSSGHRFPLSSPRRRSFASRSPAKPVSSPVDPMTRWHGAMIEIGFLPFAAPTARDALGLPICLAISP